MRSLKDYISEREMRRTGGTPENAGFHSKNYRRYFEGFSEYTENSSKGPAKIRRTYTGLCRKQLLTDRQRIILRIGYCLLWLSSALLFLFSATRNTASNTVIYVTIPEALSVAGLGWMGWSLFNYMTAGKTMTINDFRYVASVKNSSRFTSIALFCCAAATLIHILINFQDKLITELLCMAVLLLSGASSLAVYLIEIRIPYETFSSDKVTPPGSNQISV